MPLGKAGEIRGFASAGHYIQGPGVMGQLPEILRRFGRHAMVVMDPFFYDSEKGRFCELLPGDTYQVEYLRFEGECSRAEIDKTVRLFAAEGIDVVVGFGGGKTLDTVRVAAAEYHIPMILMPTSTSSNAATSGLSVVYDENHAGKTEFLYRNPDFILADTEYIVKMPPRMLASGNGDSLATYYEARNNWRVNNINTVMPGYRPTICGKVIARSCRDVLLEKGRMAYRSLEHHIRSDAFEDIVEAINLLSGIGWENNGCSITHGLASALTSKPDTHVKMHGETVAYCLLIQLLLDGEPDRDFREIYDFCRALGLPVCLTELGITDSKEKKILKVIDRALETEGILFVANREINREVIQNAVMLLETLSAENQEMGRNTDGRDTDGRDTGN